MDLMHKISNCEKLADQNEMYEQNQKAYKWNKRCKTFFEYACCWRVNSRNSKIMSEDEKSQIRSA